ncbi:O-antigen ligase family protein [Janthinobacterium sp. GMG1]|uniref:O-antigen ligase family protein n=1 Tax=Janthinobacterium sp. GMG1 TaxID=3096007 RepID=UPI002AC9FDE6|nr:O-antigen ligase family protein [Janthinobacterium sp. GMG1]MDZ5632415.1 O-antigen ligase family protein [Janthinobacterium sp. GMG1]
MLGLTSVCVFLFFALALAVNSGYSLGALVLLLASSWLLWKRPRLHLQRRDYLMLVTLLLYFFIFTANMLYHADPARELDIPLRALLAAPVMLLLLAYPPRPSAWWSGVAIGAMTGAALAFWQLIVLHLERPQAATSNAIHYGNVSMLMGMLALCGLGWAREQRHRMVWSIFLLAGALAGVLGSIVSGSRGGWLALPVCAGIIVLHHAKTSGKRHIIRALVVLVALAAVTYAMPDSQIRKRVHTAVEEAQNFQYGADLKWSSVGQRLEMWRTALLISRDHVLVGVGRTGYLEEKRVLMAEGKMSNIISEYTNAHNDYLDALVKRGIVGVMALLALFLVPLSLFARALRHSAPATQPYALAGVVLCTCYMIFGLTTSSLTLNIGIIMLVFPMVILWAMLRQQERIA